MRLEDLKKKMSELDDTLAKTKSNIKIDVKASKSAQTKLLEKIRDILIFFVILFVVFGIMILCGMTPSRFSTKLNILLEIYIAVGGLWYAFIFYKLRKLDIATLKASKLISETAQIKVMMLCGELTGAIGFVILMLIFGPTDGDAIWILCVSGAVAIYMAIKKRLPEYRTLFKEMNSVE